MRRDDRRAGRDVAAILTTLFLSVGASLLPGATAAIESEAWSDPPFSARPVARWWWPGGAVDEAGIKSELRRMRDAGYGAVELQPLLLGMSQADMAADPRIRSVGDDAFVRHVGIAAREARSLGLAFDITVGSGWPGGVPGNPDAAERQLLMASVDIASDSPMPLALPRPEEPGYVADVQRFLDTMGPFDRELRSVAVLAVEVTKDGTPTQLGRIEDLTDRVKDAKVTWKVPAGRWRLLAFYENRTHHSVLGGAYPGDAYDALTVDHLHPRGAQAMWTQFVAPLLAGSPAGSVRGLFIDSFELIGELPWTLGFRASFQARKGYDLTPYLPILFREGGESKYSEMVDFFGSNGGPRYLAAGGVDARARVREDNNAVREALFLETFIGTFMRLGAEHDVTIRLQAHGGFADYLDAYALADIPESEALFAGGSSDFLKLASSAAHVAGRRISSSESCITQRVWGHELEPREFDLLAGRALSAGINQIVHHGVPYETLRSDEEAWYPFSGGFGRVLAGPLPMTNWIRGPWWDRLPAINTRIARLCYAMQQGDPVTDVAWLRAEGEFPDAPSFEFGLVDPHEGESVATRVLRERGLVHDRISRKQLRGARVEGGSLRVGAARYRALILDPLHVAEPTLVESALAIARAGIPVLSIGSLPTRAPGLANAAARDASVVASVTELQSVVRIVADEEALAKALEAVGLEGPLVSKDGEGIRFSIDHRKTKSEHILLVFNESWDITRQTLKLNVGAGPVLRWDPNRIGPTDVSDKVGSDRSLEIDLEPAQSIILTIPVDPKQS
jgi:hypothetical protein